MTLNRGADLIVALCPGEWQRAVFGFIGDALHEIGHAVKKPDLGKRVVNPATELALAIRSYR